MGDSTFKNRPITFPQGWSTKTRGSEIGSNRYRSDRSFVNDQGKIVCIAESSSTNDRKVGVGELCLADKFFADSESAGILIFSLCGRSQYPPTPKLQAKYLEPYFRHLKRIDRVHGVRELYFISESDFESLAWIALNEDFLAKAVALKA